MMNVHNIIAFSYKCRICSKNYDNISSIKSHYPACKRKNEHSVSDSSSNTTVSSCTTSKNHDNQVTTTDNTVVQHDTSEEDDAPNADPLQCGECMKASVIFLANETKQLVTHMRHKHPEAYESAKKVATKRIAWTTDEDQVLARLEIELKEVRKGQILERLCIAYNKLTKQSNSNKRTKDAIRTRRQQQEYKKVMQDMMSLKDNDDGEDSEDESSSSSSSESVSIPITNTLCADYTIEIKQYVQVNILDCHVNLSNSMLTAVNKFIDTDEVIDTLQLSIAGINEAISNVRNRSSQSTPSTRTTVGSNKPIRNLKRYNKARELGYYQNLFYRNKEKLVSELIDGEQPNVDPPPIDIAVEHYKKIWTKQAVDNAEIKPKPKVNGDVLLAPITKDEILKAIKNTKSTSAAGPDHITLQEAKAIANTQLFAAFNIWI
ncbi:unnamed protein product, partial [Adineta steineri]